MNAPGAHEPAEDPAEDPAALLHDVDRLRADTRSAGRAWWFPLVLFGSLVTLASPFYLSFVPDDVAISSRYGSALAMTFTSTITAFPVATALYWVAALAVGFLGSGLWYRRQAERVGLRRPVAAFVATGLAITVGLVLVQQMPYAGIVLFWITMRGTVAITIISISLLVLARLERSAGLAWIAVAFLGVAVLVSTYDVENLIFRMGVPWGPWAGMVPVLLPGLFLVAAGLAARALTAPRPAVAVPA